MSKQLHKNFVDEQVKLLLKSYVDKGYCYIKEILERDYKQKVSLTTSLNFTLILKNIFHYLFYSDKCKWSLKLLPPTSGLYQKQ